MWVHNLEFPHSNMDIVVTRNNKNTNYIFEDNRCLVMLSSYNGENYIKEQIDSILAQEGVDVHLLVRDDGSTDNTLNILNDYSNKYSDKVEVVCGQNVGIHQSYKLLIENAPSDYSYFSFSDQDDVWDHDKLIHAIIALKQSNCVFYSCAARLVDNDNLDLRRNTSRPEKFLFYMNGNSKVLTPGAQGCTIVITKEVMSFLISKNIPGTYGHDTWIPVVSYFIFNCIYDSNTHMNYRQHNNSWTGNRNNRIKQFYTETLYYFKGLARYKSLAKDMLERFDTDLDEKDKNILRAIAAENMNISERIKAITKYKFGKYGWKENIIYKIYYILGL